MNTRSSGLLNFAMWSGPRNISTAMMRAWENRSDCKVWDEPLYAAYLKETGISHPMRDTIIEHHESDWRVVIKRCSDTFSDQSHRVFYQKHMSHHFLPHFSRQWLLKLRHCFLLRNPEQVLSSYVRKRSYVELTDIGVKQQYELYHWLCNHHDSKPLVIDSADFLNKPELYLRAICADLKIEFESRMLSWPKGPRESDGVWASHWYNRVWESTGFKPAKYSKIILDKKSQSVLRQAMPYYEKLHAQRLSV